MHFVTELNFSILFNLSAEKQIRSSYEQGWVCSFAAKLFKVICSKYIKRLPAKCVLSVSVFLLLYHIRDNASKSIE